MKHTIALAVALIAAAAQATPAATAPSSRAAARAAAIATQRVQIGITAAPTFGAPTSSSSASGGSVSMAGGSFGGAGGSLSLAGASIGTSERSAPAVFAPPASIPAKSCRLTMGAGGSGTQAAATLGVPIGNDQLCLSAAAFDFLDGLKSRGVAVSADDYTRAACAVEGMANLSPCKALAERDAPRVSPAADRPARAESGRLPAPWLAGG